METATSGVTPVWMAMGTAMSAAKTRSDGMLPPAATMPRYTISMEPPVMRPVSTSPARRPRTVPTTIGDFRVWIQL